MDTQIEVEGGREGWERKKADIRSGTIVWELRAHPKPRLAMDYSQFSRFDTGIG